MAGLGEGFLRMDASYLEILLGHLAEEQDRQFYIVRTAGIDILGGGRPFNE